MGFKKVAELVIQGVEDRLTVSSILIKNGYTVGPDKRKRTPTGKTLDYELCHEKACYSFTETL